MTQPMIEINGLSKRYRLGKIGARTLRDELQMYWRALAQPEVPVKTGPIVPMISGLCAMSASRLNRVKCSD